MGLPNNSQYIRGMALENATRIAASGCLNKDSAYGTWDLKSILDLADHFADYIQFGGGGDDS